MALQSSDSGANGFNAAVRDAWLSHKFMALFYQRSPLFKKLQMNGQIKRAGYGIMQREPLLVPVLTGPQMEGVSNSFADIQPQALTGYTSAKYPLSQYLFDFAVEDYQMREAGGPEEEVRWMEANFQNANLRCLNKLLSDFWKAPENALSAGDRTQIASIRTFINGGTTAATDGGADPPAQAEQSANGVVQATGQTAVTLVGTIQRSAAGAAYWCPSFLGASGTSVALTVQILNDLYEAAFQDGEEPDMIILPPNLFGKIQNLITVGGGNGGQMFGESGKAKLGFSYVMFRNAMIAVDKRCPTSGFYSGGSSAAQAHCFCLNLRHIKFRADGTKPKYRQVFTNKPINEQVGDWYCCITADHLGNLHSFRADLTT